MNSLFAKMKIIVGLFVFFCGLGVDQLAQVLITDIDRLQKAYGIHTFPVVHNLLIDLHLKKRGH